MLTPPPLAANVAVVAVTITGATVAVTADEEDDDDDDPLLPLVADDFGRDRFIVLPSSIDTFSSSRKIRLRGDTCCGCDDEDALPNTLRRLLLPTVSADPNRKGPPPTRASLLVALFAVAAASLCCCSVSVCRIVFKSLPPLRFKRPRNDDAGWEVLGWLPKPFVTGWR